ncbi:hypothetical protein ACSFCX_19710 [Yokenella regensburgei]
MIRSNKDPGRSLRFNGEAV